MGACDDSAKLVCGASRLNSGNNKLQKIMPYGHSMCLLCVLGCEESILHIGTQCPSVEIYRQ